MTAYLIAGVEVIDQNRQQVPATIAAHGGRYLARGGATKVLEGTWSPKRCVIVEFPSMEQLEAWWSSPEYAPLRAIRERAARSNLVVTQGL
jgi:uncharacterized protein (DUF1330 family)